MNSELSKVDILVVDDIPDNVMLLARMLRRRGYEVETAENGFEALEKVKLVRPDLILLDVSMPKMDGFQVCETLKADDSTKDIPIIFLSAHSEQVDKLRGFQVGAVDYVAKPFHFHEVAARVAAHIELYRHRRENERLRAQEQGYFDKVNQLKNELIHTVTHNLKNPLTSIKLSVSLVQRLAPSENPKINRYYDNIENDLDRMLMLISNLLDLAKIETTSTMKLSTIVLEDFLNKMLEHAAGTLAKKQIKASVVPNTEDRVNSICDTDQVGQVLVKVVEELSTRVEREGHIEICYWTVGDEVLVSISDRESGIQETDSDTLVNQELAEDDFEQQSELGMPIMQAIFERQGGRIWQDFQTGDYRFTLPYFDPDKTDASAMEKETKQLAEHFKRVMQPM